MSSTTHADAAEARRPWIELGLLWLGAIALFLVWILGRTTGTLREHLKIAQLWSLDAAVIAATIAIGYVIREASRTLARADLVRMAGLATFALVLTLAVAPRTNRIFYDEHIYQAIGQNFADLRLAQVCGDGAVEYGRLQCASGEYNKQPYAYPHALSLAYRVFGVRESLAFAVNAAAMAASVCVVYLIAWLLFADRAAATFAGAALALMPQQLLWSATAAVEPTSSLAGAVTFLCAAYYLRWGGPAALFALAALAAYAIQFRPESILILPVAALLVWPRLKADVGRIEAWWAALIFFALAATHFAHLFAVRHAGWGATGPRFSLEYVRSNLQVNGWFYVWDERFPALLTALAVIGLAGRAFGRERLTIGLYFGVFFATLLAFYAGSYNYGADVRYSLTTYPPIALAAGIGAARLARALDEVGSPVAGRVAVAGALLFQFLWYAPVVRATTEEAWGARADVRFARSFAAELPPDAYVLTHNPGMFHLWGVNAGQLSRIISNPVYVAHLRNRYIGGVYIHWNFWCGVQDPVQTDFCHRAMEQNTVELAREHRERDQRFAFYRLVAPR